MFKHNVLHLPLRGFASASTARNLIATSKQRAFVAKNAGDWICSLQDGAGYINRVRQFIASKKAVA